MIEEGMATEEEMWNTEQSDITDIKSEARLRLIFDTNVRQAYGYGKWKQGQSPEVKAAYPAARLIRERGVTTPRPRHQANLGEIRHKDDPWWAQEMNDPKIGGFAVPWGPYGFNSGVDQEDVPLEEWEKLLAKQSAPPPPESPQPEPGLNEGLSASTSKMDPEIKRRLLAELRATGEERAKIIEDNDRFYLQLEKGDGWSQFQLGND
ncbi:hypothetical protein JIN85_20300 [Luteolibacter pohnpeiensis]|uniref:Uncharacterized protein n=1 Tax=Luteolibacter pohnpeiensis TaxID=454153 RepID=A0A934VXV2_9BACT|nr:hypothetical protein [Luteolibacter pohnpeiensis]